MPLNYNAVGMTQPWRLNYELYAAGCWAAGGVGYVAYAFLGDLPAAPSLCIAGLCGVMSAAWAPRAFNLWMTQRNLAGRPLTFCTFEELQALCNAEGREDQMWLGRGFKWTTQHTQAVYDLIGRNWVTLSQEAGETQLGGLARKAKEKTQTIRSVMTGGSYAVSESVAEDMGQRWIHGVEPREVDLWQKMKHVEGHCLIVGTTGAGKAQPLSAKVLTPSGWTTMGRLSVGTEVMTPRGSVAHVKKVFDRGIRPMRRIVTTDGRMTTACTEHLWSVYVTEVKGRSRSRSVPLTDLLTGKTFGSPMKLADLTLHMASAGLSNLPVDLLGIKPSVLTTTVLERLLDAGFRLELPLARPAHDSRQMLRKAEASAFAAILHGKKPSDDDRVVLEAFLGPIDAEHEETIKMKLVELDSGSREALLAALEARAKPKNVGGQGGFRTMVFGSGLEARLARELARSLGMIVFASSERELSISADSAQLGQNLIREVKGRLENGIAEADQYSPMPRVQISLISPAPSERARCIMLDDPSELYITDDWIVTHNTRMFDLLISQAVLRNETVFIIDPKGDRELMENAKLACEKLGRPECFFAFHPATPEKSIKFDPLANWSKVSDIPSRIAALITTSGAGETFKAFGWRVMNVICEGLLFMNRRPTLVLLRRYLEGGVESLFQECLEKYAIGILGRENYLSHCKEIADRMSGDKRLKVTKTVVMEKLYTTVIQKDNANVVIEGLLQMTEHDAAHASKMLASLLPIMSMLTSGSLSTLLSPPEGENLKEGDEPYMDSAQLIGKNGVVYIGLDALSDSTVASAIGSLILADLTAVAGGRYNFEVGSRPVNIFIDEAAEVLNEPMIQMLNKGRGAKLRLFVATQTLSDLAAKLGSKEKATQVVANVNNTFALRLNDRETQEYIAERMPKTRVKRVEHTQSQSMTGEDAIMHGGSLGERLTEEETEMVPAPLFGLLPNLEFFGVISGGTIIKSRIPILTVNKPEKK